MRDETRAGTVLGSKHMDRLSPGGLFGAILEETRYRDKTRTTWLHLYIRSFGDYHYVESFDELWGLELVELLKSLMET